ncbi:MAG: HlyD family secretion protein [Candidatus Omnitrophica bacterium]|nr:HlyD family secretion protein [Candidatus Omnitrophota bacterium]
MEAEQGRAKGKKVIGFLVVIALAFGVGVWSVHMLEGLNYIATDDAYITGRIHQVSARIPGTVRRVVVADNQTVKQGELLAEIDPSDYIVKVQDARAAYLAELARYREALTRINVAKTNVEIQATSLRQAETDSRRAERLFAEGAYALERLEKARTATELAKSQVKSAGEQVLQAQAACELEAALVKQREAALAIARLNLGYTKLRAAADGMVTKKSVEDGNQVQPGQPLMAVVPLEDVWVVANFKETQLRDVRPGQEVLIHVDTYSGQTFSGKVQSVMAGTGAAFSLFPAENALGNYVKIVQRIPVKIVLDRSHDPSRPLRVGMSVVARVRVK